MYAYVSECGYLDFMSENSCHMLSAEERLVMTHLSTHMCVNVGNTAFKHLGSPLISIKRENGWNCGILVSAYTIDALSHAARMGDAGSITAHSAVFGSAYMLPYLIMLRCNGRG